MALAARLDQPGELVGRQRGDSPKHQIIARRRRFSTVDADAECDAPLRCRAGTALDHAPLQFDGALHRRGRIGELDDQITAGVPHDTTAMLLNLGIHHLTAIRLQPLEGAFLVLSDQA
jgi:hypothetical protein